MDLCVTGAWTGYGAKQKLLQPLCFTSCSPSITAQICLWYRHPFQKDECHVDIYTTLPPLNHSDSENRPIRARQQFVHTINPPCNLRAMKTAQESAGFTQICMVLAVPYGSIRQRLPHVQLPPANITKLVLFPNDLTAIWRGRGRPKTDQHQLLANSLLQFLFFSQRKSRVQASILGYWKLS